MTDSTKADSTKADDTRDSDMLVAEHDASSETGLVNPQIDLDSELYQMHRVALLPGQILTDTMERLAFTIKLVGLFYSALFFVLVVLAIGLLLPDLIFVINQKTPLLMILAKLAISLLSIGMGLACVGLFLQERGLTSKLALAEVMIDTLRDKTMVNMRATRYNLEDLTERLKYPKEEEEGAEHRSPLDYIELARKVGPVISLLMAKEKSVITIAVEGVKLLNALKKVLKK
jgi:hypothetical protein